MVFDDVLEMETVQKLLPGKNYLLIVIRDWHMGIFKSYFSTEISPILRRFYTEKTSVNEKDL